MKKRAPVEWIGGVTNLPAYVTGEGEPYRPLAAFWIAGGLVLGVEVAGRSITPAQILRSFQATTRKPMAGSPHVPTRVRVASPELAETLRAELPSGVEVVCAPTPELDDLLDTLRKMDEAQAGDDGEDTYLAPGIGADQVASFFRAAARLHRAAPWKVVPGDAYVVGVASAGLGVKGAVISVIGQMGTSFGFVLFASHADYEAYVDAASSIQAGQVPRLPLHMALNYDRGADLGPHRRKEIAAHGWEVAGAHAYPSVMVVDEDMVGRPATPEELTRVEAIAGALAELIEKVPRIADAWRGQPVVHTCAVPTSAGPVEITLSAPADAGEAVKRVTTASGRARRGTARARGPSRKR